MGEHTPVPTPSRGVYGFVLYITCVCAFGIYIIWAFVPDTILHSLGITYYPQKYWAIALPVYVMMGIALFAFILFPCLGELLAPPLDSINTLTDSYAVYEETTNFDLASKEQCQGIPSAADLHISNVCRALYLENKI